MNQPPRLAVSSRRVVTDEGVHPGTILIEGGRITAVASYRDAPRGFDRSDYADAVIMPGLVDAHVHINEPGRAEWEGFTTATRAAAAGGVTTLMDMPLNCTPVTTTVAALERKRQAADGRIFVDCGFYGGLVPGSDEHLEGLIAAGVFGIKTFLIDSGIDDFPAIDRATLTKGMSVIAKYPIPLLVHAEMEASSHTSVGDDWTDYNTYLRSRPESWETDAISLLAGLSQERQCRTHIVHLATASALETIKEGRAARTRLTVETCPHYLYFDAESIGDGETLFKCAPPIRDRANNNRLLDALIDGQIDFVTSDHSPTVPSAKAIESGDFREAWGGIASLQLRLPVMWTLARGRDATFCDLSRWLAEHPAQFLGISHMKGRIRPGNDADLVIWDPEASFTVAREILHDRHRLTPYLGEVLFGVVKATYLRGKPVFEDDRFPGPTGRLLSRGPSAT